MTKPGFFSTASGTLSTSLTAEQDRLRRELVVAVQRSGTFVCKHPGIAGTATLVLGAITLLTYFLPLGFIPDFDFSSITGLLLLAAFLGAVQILWLGSCLLFPSILGVMNVVQPDKGRYKLPVISLVSTAVWFVAFWRNTVSDEHWFWFGLPAVLGCTLVLATLPPTRKLARSLFGFWIQGIIFLFAAFLFHPAPQSGISEASHLLQWILLAGWCLLVSTENVLLVKHGRPTLLAILGVAAYLIFTLMFATQNWGFVHGMTVRMLSLGDVRGAVVAVGDTGAVVLQAACKVDSPPVSCEPQTITIGKISGYAYQNIRILSRIGNQYYLQMCSDGEKGGACGTPEGLRVVLEKHDILGWSIAGTKREKVEPTL